jgi:hypothetical protein
MDNEILKSYMYKSSTDADKMKQNKLMRLNKERESALFNQMEKFSNHSVSKNITKLIIYFI